LVHFVFIWYIFPVLVSCTWKNLATRNQYSMQIWAPQKNFDVKLCSVFYYLCKKLKVRLNTLSKHGYIHILYHAWLEKHLGTMLLLIRITHRYSPQFGKRACCKSSKTLNLKVLQFAGKNYNSKIAF
jgi:hypothetical protein